MNFYQINCQALFKNHQDLQKVFTDKIPVCHKLKIFNTPSGHPSASYDDYYIHSRHNPKREAEKIISQKIPGDISICIFLGFGLGYLIECFIEHFPSIPAIIVEPDLSFFKKALESRNMEKILASKNITFLFAFEAELITPILENRPCTRVQIVKLRSTYDKYKAYYQRMENIIQSFLHKREINKNTLKRFGKLWIRNLMKNIKLIASTPGVSLIEKIFSGLPGLVLAAGPSLDQILPILKELSFKMIIVAVDTSYKICLEAGVEPDFLVVVDPQYWNTRHLDRAAQTSTILISESSTHPRIFKILKLPVFFGSSLFPFGQYLEKIIGEKGKIGAGGSVSTSAWDIARLIGLNPIYMAGLDLGFPAKKTHFKGGFFEELFFILTTRINSPAQMSYNYLNQANPFPVPANSDKTCLTDQRMITYKYWFETQMKLHPTTKTHNLSLSGIKIQGMPYCELNSLLCLNDIFTQKQVKKEQIKSIYTEHQKSNVKIDLLHDSLLDLLKELISLQRLCQEGLKLTQNLTDKLKKNKNPRPILDKLNEIDQALLKLASRNIVDFLIQGLIDEIMAVSGEKHNPNSIIKNTKNLYSELLKSIKYHQKILKNGLFLLNQD